MLDSVVIDTNAYEQRQDELEADGQTRDELRAESAKEWLECWIDDPSYLCIKLAKQDGAENQCADLFELIAAMMRDRTSAFAKAANAYAEQLAKEAYPE